MKQPISILFVLLLAIITSCNMDTDHTQEIKQMEDSVFASFPTVNRVTVKVSSDFSKEIVVTMGDKQLYNGSEDERTKVVSRTEKIVKNIFKEKTPGKGEVHFVEEENTLNSAPGSEKKYPLILTGE